MDAGSLAGRTALVTGAGRRRGIGRSIAVELAREIVGSLNGKRVLVVGAGKMAESAARHLRRAGVSDIAVTNRTRERATAMAEEVGSLEPGKAADAVVLDLTDYRHLPMHFGVNPVHTVVKRGQLVYQAGRGLRRPA